MKYFFDNLSVTIKESFEAFKEISLKKKIIALVAILLVIALIVTGTLIHKSRQKPNANPDEIALSYAQCISEKDYYPAYEYTILGKNGVDNYIDKNYLSEFENKDELTEQEHYAVINVCESLDKELSVFMSTYGISDYDNFFAAYIQSAENLIVTYLKETAPSDRMIIECIKYSLNSYKKEYEASLNEHYKSNYAISLAEPEILEFTEEEVQVYIENKSERANAIFMKSGMEPSDIKAVKKYTYNVSINGDYVSSIMAYMVKIGAYWYVDTTALVY